MIPEHLQLNMAKVKATIDRLIAERDAAVARLAAVQADANRGKR